MYLDQTFPGVVFDHDCAEQGDKPAYGRGQPHNFSAAQGNDHLVERQGAHHRDQPSECDRHRDDRRLQLFRERVPQQRPGNWPKT